MGSAASGAGIALAHQLKQAKMPRFWADGLLWVAKIALTDMHGGSLTPIDELTDESLRGNLSKFAPNWDGSEKLWRRAYPKDHGIKALWLSCRLDEALFDFVHNVTGG